MTQDISRLLNQPRKHYAGVRLEEGRVLLDADFNEAAVLDEDDQQRIFLELIGPEGSPDQGFTIGQPFPTDPPETPEQTARLRPGDVLVSEEVTLPTDFNPVFVHNVTIRPGRMFLGGRRFDLERAEPILFQRDFLQARVGAAFGEIPPANEEVSSGDEFRHLFYLHSWEQNVTAVEDQELAEVMLRGSDTSVRVRRMRRVEVLPVAEDVGNCEEAFEEALIPALEESETLTFDDETFELKSTARLQLTFTGEDEETGDPCGPCAASGQYLGSENATLRIMLATTTSFVWALDNGTPLFRITLEDLGSIGDGDATVTIEMLTPPTREDDLPVANRVIEILPFAALLEGGDLPEGPPNPHFRKVAAEVGVFALVTTSYSRDTGKFTVHLEEAQADAVRKMVSVWHERHPAASQLNIANGDPNTRHFYLRLWHQAAEDDDPSILITSTDALGDTGVVPVFTSADPTADPGDPIGRPGDFWIATLRTEDPEHILPFEVMVGGGVQPDGPHHFFTPLALVHAQEETEGEITALVVQDNGDCRSRLRRVGDRACFTCTVGDGVTSSGDFLSIQDAIESLPSSGGRIGIRPGHYDEQVVIEGRRGVILEGCGVSTVIETPDFFPSGPLVDVRDSADVSLIGLTLRAVDQTALAVRRVTDLTLENIHVTADTVQPEPPAPETALPIGALSKAPLVDLAQVGSAEIRSLVLRPVQRPGLLVRQSELVAIRELDAAGEESTLFPPSAPLVTIADSELVRVEGARLEPFGQVGVLVRGNTRDVELRGLTVRGGTNTAQFPDQRGFQLAQELLRGEGPDEDSPSPRSPDPPSDFEDELQAEDPPDEVVSEPQSCVDIDGGEGIRLVKCHLKVGGDSVSEHALVIARGRDIVIEDNIVEVLFECHDEPAVGAFLECADLRGAFGGIRIRGGSEGVEIRRNRIQGGFGHGITLGSALWHITGSSPLTARRIGGAGTGQLGPLQPPPTFPSTRIALGRNIGNGFEDDEGNDFVPRNEGRIRDLVIADNRIKGMFASGISVLTVLGLLSRGGEFIEIEAARIEGNTIEGNLLRPGLDLPDIGDVMPFPASLSGPSVISVLPFGGIVLGTVTGGLDILNNVIRDNGVGVAQTTDFTKILPINGVFVLNGEGLNITGNHIVNNGARLTLAEGQNAAIKLRPGVRAGIAVMLAGTGPTNDIGELRYFVGGRGSLTSDNSSLRVTDNKVIQPEGRALHAVATGPMTIDGNFLSSRGYHGSRHSVDRLAVGDVVFVQNLGTPWEASDLGSVITRSAPTSAAPKGVPSVIDQFGQPYQVATNALNHLLNTEDLQSPRMYIGDGGSILFNNNQVIYDWDVLRITLQPPTPLSYFSVVVIGLDHVGINGNQFALRINRNDLQPQAPPIKFSGVPTLPGSVLLLANVFALGGTTQVTRNRSAENVGMTYVSLLTSAEILNITALNQTTNFNAVYSGLDQHSVFRNMRRSENNQVLFNRHGGPNKSPEPSGNAQIAIAKALRFSFSRLLRRRTR